MKKQLKKKDVIVWTGRFCFGTDCSYTLLPTGK